MIMVSTIEYELKIHVEKNLLNTSISVTAKESMTWSLEKHMLGKNHVTEQCKIIVVMMK